MEGLVVAGIVILFGTGLSLLSYHLGKQVGYEHGYNDGEEVGYVEGYLERYHSPRNHIPGHEKPMG